MFQTHCERWQSLIPILWRTALCINDQSVNQLSRSSLMHSFVLCHQPIRAIYVINQSTNYHIHRWCIHLFFVPSPYAYIDPLHANLNTLFVELFKDALNEYAYAAEIAGLGYNLSCSLYGISVRPSLALLAWLAGEGSLWSWVDRVCERTVGAGQCDVSVKMMCGRKGSRVLLVRLTVRRRPGHWGVVLIELLWVESSR